MASLKGNKKEIKNDKKPKKKINSISNYCDECFMLFNSRDSYLNHLRKNH